MDPNIISNPEKSREFDEELSLAHLLVKNLTKAGDKILLISGISAEELTAKDLLAKAIQVAKSLKFNGVQPHDVVSIVCENRFEFAYVLFGCILNNTTFAPCNLTYSERELTHGLTLSKPKILFTSSFASDRVVTVAKSLNFIQKVVLINDENPYGNSVELFSDFINSPAAQKATYIAEPVDKSKTVSLILCSSGTTLTPNSSKDRPKTLDCNFRYHGITKRSFIKSKQPHCCKCSWNNQMFFFAL